MTAAGEVGVDTPASVPDGTLRGLGLSFPECEPATAEPSRFPDARRGVGARYRRAFVQFRWLRGCWPETPDGPAWNETDTKIGRRRPQAGTASMAPRQVRMHLSTIQEAYGAGIPPGMAVRRCGFALGATGFALACLSVEERGADTNGGRRWQLDLRKAEAVVEQALSQREAERAREGFEPNEWADVAREVYAWRRAKTYLAAVFCGLVARATDGAANPLSLQVGDDDASRGYAATSLWQA